MAQKILTDLEVQGKIGINTTPVGSIDILESVSNATDDYGLLIDYTKASSAGGWATNLYGIRSHVKSTVASGNQTTNFNALWTKAEHTGTGLVYYLIGSTNRGVHNGSGNTGVIYGMFGEAQVIGSGVGTHPYLVGSYAKAVLNNANATVTNHITQYLKSDLSAGAATEVSGLVIDLDMTGGTVSGDVQYIKILNDAITTPVSGTARAINSLSVLTSRFVGSIESASFVKTGGTGTQFLMADGTINSTVYSTTPGLWDAVTGGINYGNGNVGIGTTNPGRMLEVVGTAPIMGLKTSNTTGEAAIYFGDTNSNSIGRIVYANSQNAFSIYTNAAERVRINNVGNVGIGEPNPQQKLHVTGRGIISDRLALGGNFTPQKLLHLKNAAPVFRFEDSDIAGSYFDIIKSSRNTYFRLDSGAATSSSKLIFQVDSYEAITVNYLGKVGINKSNPTEAIDISGYAQADGYKTPGGTSAEFLKADGTIDSTTYAEGTGTSGRIAIWNGGNDLIEDSALNWNFLSDTLTVTGDANATGDMQAENIVANDRITAGYYVNVPVMQTSNFAHTANTTKTWYAIPFNSVVESANIGEPHFMVMPYAGRVRKFIMKNTSTGTAPTVSTNIFRVLKNGTVVYTSSSTLFGIGMGQYSAWSLNDTSVTFSNLDTLTVQFQSTGLWQDVTATLLLEFI